MGNYFSPEYMIASFPVLLSYVGVSVFLTVISQTLALFLGSSIALVRVQRLRWISSLFAAYISFIRGTPFLVQLYLICFGLPRIIKAMGAEDIRALPVIVFVVVVMVLHSAAYMSEIMRGSLESIDKGQMEACYSIGMTTGEAYRRILLPQAFRIAVSSLGNEIISAIKSTSLVFNVGIVDMMSKAELMGSYSYRSLELYLDAGIIYVLLCFILHGITDFLSGRNRLFSDNASELAAESSTEQ